MAGAADVTWLPDRTLQVRARSAAWRHEIDRARPILTERLTYLLGPGTIRRINVCEGADVEPGRPVKESPCAKP